MSAIARILLGSGYTVSGSDVKASPLLDALRQEGATVYLGHHPDNLGEAEWVLVSSAVAEDNPELQAARARGLRVQDRREFLPLLLADYRVLAVAGTHGKTTTTGMIAHILLEAGYDPSYIVGGILKKQGLNAAAGGSEYFVIEADEYGHMFLGLRPSVAVLTNVEYDHPDFFPTPADLLLAFQLFLERLPAEGLLVACADDDVARTLAQEQRRHSQVQTYGVENQNADWGAIDLKPNAQGGLDFTLCRGGAGSQGVIGAVSLRLPGRHNVQNAVAAIAVARHIGIPFEEIAEALATYQGVGRRSDLMGEVGGVRVIDDYAHHPTAIRATLKAWREQNPQGRVWAVWQPHTYSRTRALIEDFQASFTAAHAVLVTDIYAARETYTAGLDAPQVAQLISAAGHPNVRYSGDWMLTAQILADEVTSGDVVVLLSAGDLPQAGRALLSALQARAAKRR